jgi:RNA polymerase sigma factor (TIGR02999 family)
MLLQTVGGDDGALSEELLPLVYDELRHLAAACMSRESASQTLQATALVHEAWLRLSRTGDRRWSNRTHFFRVAAQAMRRVLVDRSRQKASLKRGQSPDRLRLEDMDIAVVDIDDRILLIDEALSRLEAEDPESARIVTLKFFGGFTNKEIARNLQVTERTIERQWAYARACLFEMIRDGE